MENNRFYANQSCQKELEQQLKDSFLENKLLKQENKYLQFLYLDKIDHLLLKNQSLNKKKQGNCNHQQLNWKREYQLWKKRMLSYILRLVTCKNHIKYYFRRGFSQTNEILVNQKPSYTQLEQELQDLQIYLKKFIQLQESLIEQIPNINLQLCWKEINQIFKSQFNTNQSIQNLQDELKLIETTYKELVHSKDNGLTHLQEMAKCNKNLTKLEQSIRESRVEIERIRKEVQLNQMDLKQFETKLNGLQNEFTYISKIETRKNNVQMEAEKQLIEFKRGILSTKNSNHNVTLMRDTFKDRDTYKELIPEKLRDSSNVLPVTQSIHRFQRPQIEINDRYDDYQDIKTPIEKTIDQTRKKLSRQLSQASSLRDQKYI
ncbi:unnamed protein product (macronuclear) [Paramecium tetraurelia]|uniref:Uncharacterized protein n=1 Tax=Paramecium tetraurelia TaxID=5888 RepID=A0BQG2_PARTE|nr:uncharacterized protein GSPATT00031008001 [Paramecium tetraurelia]CAK60779.1 unnamed protein product [Paramecium tetraurelia]|eukprot:XP_001428177.1 hypothetical protein (macronuclear) [Paramecium tetraurelia strain d4-2]